MEDVLHYLLAAQKVVITTHVRPDGDAIGSQVALGLFLSKLGKTVTLVNHDAPPPNLRRLAEANGVMVWEDNLLLKSMIAASDCMVLVDVNRAERIGEIRGVVAQSFAKKLLIDHHLEPETWFDATYVVEEATSTAELVYRLIAAHDPSLIDADIAEALYVGIMTDTGSFRFDTVSAETHRIVADIVARGNLTVAPIHIEIFDSKNANGIRLMGEMLRTLKIRQSGKIAYAYVSQEMIRKCYARVDDSEGFVNLILGIAGVEVAVLFVEIDMGVKMSFRSKGFYAVNVWAERFAGGGHRNASGAFIKGQDLQDVIRDVMGVAAALTGIHKD